MKKTGFALIVFVFLSTLFGAALSLSKAKTRNPQLKKFLYRAKGEKRKWAKFIVEDMPTIDLVSLNSDSMLADFDALENALDSVPWTDSIPDEFFYRYILPYRVSQEPLEYFRKNHWKELWKRVEDCKDMKSAVYKLNEWAYEKMKYEPTSRWDQNAEQTLIRGIGRCEEMAILFIKACRAMGIPARDAYTPYWPFTNSNHAWVEVWTGDKWHFVGGAEMTELDNGWFYRAVRKAAIIKGIAWGELDSADVPIYYADNGFTILNLTPNYSDTTGLSLSVFDNNGEPVESADVWISVFNYSSLRPVAHHYTDENGKTHFVLGKAELFVSAGKDSLYDYAILPIFPVDKSTKITLKLSRTNIPDTIFWLKVVKNVDVEKDTSYKPPKISYCRHDLNQEKLTACSKDLFEHLPDSTDETKLIDCINRARGNRESLLAFWSAHPDEHSDILKLWESMSNKDILLIDSTNWEILWKQTAKIRKRFDEYKLADSLFWDYVANPRILWEDYENWYPQIWKKVKNFEKYSFDKKVMKAENLVQKLDTLTDRSYFGGMMNPALVLKARTGGKVERLAVFAATMRALGIPARISWDYNSAEYFNHSAGDSGEWQRFELKSKSKDEKERKTGIVRTIFRNNGEPKTELDYYDNFSIVKIEDGAFDDLTPPKNVVDSFVIFEDIDCGNYAFMTGWRNAYGSPFIRIKPFTVVDGTTDIAVELGIPPPEIITPGDLVVRKFEKLGDEKIKDTRGKSLKKSDWKNGTMIIAFFDTEHENSISTAKKLANVKDISMMIFIETTSKTKAKKFCRQNGLNGRIFYGDKAKLKKILKFRQEPSILMLSNGEALMWTEGLNLNIDKFIDELH
ncbi:hypothetical protein J7L68_02095 [bacterium]|nr:hypothetical protein [bacterium]